MNHSFDPFRPIPDSDGASVLKLEATRLQDAARAKGTKLSRGAALEAVAKLRGYRDWNAAAAAVAAAGADLSTGAPWRNIDAEIPSLPMRIVRAGDPGHAAVREVMRWAQQMDAIADKVADEDRASMLELVGGDVPYVFVQDGHRWPDRLYRLCDRGYEPFANIAFTREQLAEVGAVAWCDFCGSHSGTDMVSVVHDEVRHTRDRVKLKQVARLLGSIAILADQLQRQSVT